MKNISELDENFKVGGTIARDGMKFFDAEKAPFSIHGVFREGEKFRRLPESVAKSVSVGVHGLHANTAGGRLRFRTDSPYVAVSAKMSSIGKMSHFAYTGSVGFDLYADNRYTGSFVPPHGITDGYESILNLDERKMREITIDFPLYSEVERLVIGLDGDSSLEAPTPYKIEKPVVFYGSSITQGGCASRPGSCYQPIVARRFGFDFINLGFSGNAKGEDIMADYIAGLDMSAFVYDYDYNAPSAEHLEKTHERMFLRIRAKNPTLPIIMMSRPKHLLTADEQHRLEIIRSTYNNAVASGDKNVYFLDGAALTALSGNEGTVDTVHPTDFGFASMAKALGDLIEKEGIL